MIHLPILRHVRRLIASAMIFGSAVLLMLWLPIRMLKTIWPSFLPYTLSGDSEVNELSLQLLLLQVCTYNYSYVHIIFDYLYIIHNKYFTDNSARLLRTIAHAHLAKGFATHMVCLCILGTWHTQLFARY